MKACLFSWNFWLANGFLKHFLRMPPNRFCFLLMVILGSLLRFLWVNLWGKIGLLCWQTPMPGFWIDGVFLFGWVFRAFVFKSCFYISQSKRRTSSWRHEIKIFSCIVTNVRGSWSCWLSATIRHCTAVSHVVWSVAYLLPIDSLMWKGPFAHHMFFELES